MKPRNAAQLAALALAGALALGPGACGLFGDPDLESYGQVCSDPYGYASPGSSGLETGGDSFQIGLSTDFDFLEVVEAAEACDDWAAATDAGVTCSAHRDVDDEPDRGRLPVARCAPPLRYAAGDPTAVLYPSSRSLPKIAVREGARLHRRLVAHEIGHAFGLPDFPYDADYPSIMVPDVRRMADAPTWLDAENVRRIAAERPMLVPPAWGVAAASLACELEGE